MSRDAPIDEAYYATMMEAADLAESQELPAALVAYERALRLAMRLDRGIGQASVEAMLACEGIRAELGDVETAIVGTDRAIGALEGLAERDSVLLAQALGGRAVMCAALDRLDEAVENATRSAALLAAARGQGGDDPRIEALLDNVRSMLEQIEAARAGKD